MIVVILLLLAVLVVYQAVDWYRNQHPNERLLRREYRRLLEEGASDSEAAAGAADAVRSQEYTERLRGKTVQSFQRDTETGMWRVNFEDGTYLPVILPKVTGSPSGET